MIVDELLKAQCPESPRENPLQKPCTLCDGRGQVSRLKDWTAYRR
jgi:hypothetical protein